MALEVRLLPGRPAVGVVEVAAILVAMAVILGTAAEMTVSEAAAVVAAAERVATEMLVDVVVAAFCMNAGWIW